MPDIPSEPPIAAALRRAGHDLPPDAMAGLAHGGRLLAAMLARLPAQPPEAEPATVFRPETAG